MSRSFFAGSLLVALAAPAAAEHKPESFAAVVEANFSRWDANRDGKLTAEEVDKAVFSPAVTGDAAAAVAAIHVHLRAPHAPASVTEAELTRGGKSETARRDKDDKGSHFSADYAGFAHHIATAPRQVFAAESAPTLEGMSQGRLGDCYFVSAIGAAVHRNPQAVRRMFHDHPDGSVEVAFPNGRTVRVGKLTDAEIALGSTAHEQGLWLNVLEKAFGELKIRTPRAKKHEGDIDLDVIARGGDADQTISLLTGHKASYGPIRKGKGKELPPPAEHEAAEIQTRLNELLREAAGQHALVCAGTSGGKLPPGVISDHDYAVLGYDSGSRTVTVWNPWGQNHPLKEGSPGLERGYEVKGGKFTVPLHDFVRIFEGVYYETRTPDARGRR